MIDRRFLLQGAAATASLAAASAHAQTAPLATVETWADGRETTGALPHIWEESVGSDRASITLRDSWRRDMDRLHKEVGTKRARFHGIFSDELGVYAPSIVNRGRVDSPNFQNIGRVYDGLQTLGLDPYIELGFMPKVLASGEATFGFYNGNITPPKSMDAWADFIRQFVTFLLERYGLETVSRWPFEVWNEPNLPFFWTGDQQTYFELYKATAVAIKSLDPRLQVGGPSTSAVQWMPEFAAYCAQNNAPVDFITTHVYAGDDQAKLFGENRGLPQPDVIPAAVGQARRQLDAAGLQRAPLHLTEWSSDSPAMIAHVIDNCLPHLTIASHWVGSSTYEELGVLDFMLKEGDSGFGMLIEQIPKPAFNTYKLMHALGTTRVASSGPVMATRRDDGSTAVLVWNLADVKQPSGIPGVVSTREVNGTAKRFSVTLRHARPGQTARVRFVDQERGSPMPTWRAMGSPKYLTLAQIQTLRERAEIQPAVQMRLDRARTLTFDLPPEGVALIELA